MPSAKSFLHRARDFFSPPPATVQMGIIYLRGSFHFCSPDFKARGVKVVAVSRDVVMRYNRALAAWNAVQSELESLPATLRPRKKSPRPSGLTE